MSQLPLICGPITGDTTNSIASQVKLVVRKQADVIEWRADFFKDLSDEAAVIAVLDMIQAQTSIPVMFTIRSEREGGQPVSLTSEDLLALLEKLAKHEVVSFVDYEMDNETKSIERVKQVCQRHKKKLILSYHHFSETPSNEHLLERGKRAEALGASIVKLAVMPQSEADVRRLLFVTGQLDQMLQVPIITMSMGEQGKKSRVIGWMFGSMLTFAVGVESSAPGQIDLKDLRVSIENLKQIV